MLPKWCLRFILELILTPNSYSELLFCVYALPMHRSTISLVENKTWHLFSSAFIWLSLNHWNNKSDVFSSDSMVSVFFWWDIHRLNTRPAFEFQLQSRRQYNCLGRRLKSVFTSAVPRQSFCLSNLSNLYLFQQRPWQPSAVTSGMCYLSCRWRN